MGSFVSREQWWEAVEVGLIVRMEARVGVYVSVRVWPGAPGRRARYMLTSRDWAAAGPLLVPALYALALAALVQHMLFPPQYGAAHWWHPSLPPRAR